MAMQRIAMGVEYNGSLFRGFQSQSSGVATVQQAIELALSSICNEPITLVCAGRTDTGVHATNQVIHFDTLAKRPERAWLRGLNTQLPKGVSIRWAQVVIPLFHARFSARARTYRYIIYNTLTPSALMDGLVTWDRRHLDIEAMIEGSRYLLGEHNFNAFRGADCQASNPVRHIDHIVIRRAGDFIVIEVKASAFLYHMVRNIVGVLSAVAAAEKPAKWVKQVLDSQDRRCGGVTAPAAGLYLVAVDYSTEFGLPECIKGPYILGAGQELSGKHSAPTLKPKIRSLLGPAVLKMNELLILASR
ncbi:MAG: tRNA pseudouridine(38-40) synthase TruA [Cyanobacteria bacterium P01_A01_bin.17]